MEAKKVLIITYYWPPSGGSGVQRWLKFVKYLPQNGVQPHVYTPENPDFNVKDESFLKDIPKEAVVIKRKIIEPYGIHRLLIGKKKAKGTNFGNTNSSKESNIQLKETTTEQEFIKFRQERDLTLNAPNLLLPSIQVNIDAGRLPDAETNGKSYLKIPIKK